MTVLFQPRSCRATKKRVTSLTTPTRLTASCTTCARENANITCPVLQSSSSTPTRTSAIGRRTWKVATNTRRNRRRKVERSTSCVMQCVDKWTLASRVRKGMQCPVQTRRTNHRKHFPPVLYHVTCSEVSRNASSTENIGYAITLGTNVSCLLSLKCVRVVSVIAHVRWGQICKASSWNLKSVCLLNAVAII